MLVDGTADLPAVHRFQDACRLTPLSQFGNERTEAALGARVEPRRYDPSKPLGFFEFLDLALRENPPPARDAGLMARFAQIGIGVERPFQAASLDAAVKKG